jgi:hypothetical protein
MLFALNYDTMMDRHDTLDEIKPAKRKYMKNLLESIQFSTQNVRIILLQVRSEIG